MQRIEMYYRWLTMRIWVYHEYGRYRIEIERNDGTAQTMTCNTREDAVEAINTLRNEGNKAQCQS